MKMWKCCYKYECDWPKKVAQEIAIKFLKTFITFYEISVLYNTAFALTCPKFAKYFRFSHVLVTLLLKIISPVKSKHIKDKVILLNNILINLYLNEEQIIFFCLACINYCSGVTQITWFCGMEFFINLILQMIGWGCYVLSLSQIEQMVRKLRNTYVVIFKVSLDGCFWLILDIPCTS